MTFDPFSDPFRTGLGLSTAEIFKRRPAGGPPRPKRSAPPPVPEAEPLTLEPGNPEGTSSSQSQPKVKVKLRNPVWEVEDVGFNEETWISVEAEIPPSLAHKTRVEFQLFAKTPDGPEAISKCEGNVKEGKARGKIPVYIPQYLDEEGNLLPRVEYWFTAKHRASSAPGIRPCSRAW